jgi:hypothetical protein
MAYFWLNQRIDHALFSDLLSNTSLSFPFLLLAPSSDTMQRPAVTNHDGLQRRHIVMDTTSFLSELAGTLGGRL